MSMASAARSSKRTTHSLHPNDLISVSKRLLGKAYPSLSKEILNKAKLLGIISIMYEADLKPGFLDFQMLQISTSRVSRILQLLSAPVIFASRFLKGFDISLLSGELLQ